MEPITREQVQLYIDKTDAKIIEVLDKKYFDQFHLPGAVNVPLNENFAERIQQIVSDKEQTIIVYCLDLKCSASRKAAQQMDELGYRRVYDYEAGKMDWHEADLPMQP